MQSALSPEALVACRTWETPAGLIIILKNNSKYQHAWGRSMLALRLPPEIEARLAELAKRTGRTKSFYAREAILNHIDDLEDLYLAENRLNDLREGRSGSIPLNDLLRRHGVED
jgi:RHH-type rel operon transcriptional repressor/antitoxin RelB